jgi:hypothetical protein
LASLSTHTLTRGSFHSYALVSWHPLLPLLHVTLPPREGIG